MQTVRRLVPNFIIEKYKADQLCGSLECAAIFVDLVGFSNMVDALSAHGQLGAEALAGLMRQVFEPLVEAVYAQGGFVVGYAGDAFNAVFPADQAGGRAAERALASLVAMQENMAAHPSYETPFGVFSIAIKAGLGYGQTRWQMFKSEEGQHLTYWLRGEALNRAVFAEMRAAAGEIIADPAAQEKIEARVETEVVEGAFCIRKISAALPNPGEITEPTPSLAPMNLFFSENLLQRPIMGEFRQIVNLFIDIPVNISDEALVTPFMETVYALQDEYGGFFLRPELGDKGFNLLMFWGAPTARERDVERAIEFVMVLAKRTQLTLRAGITYRTAYAGFIGAPLREDYTAYGWGITFAARLMTYANVGEIWADEEIAQRIRHKFQVEYLGEHTIKGFSQKQKVYQISGKKSEAQPIFEGEFIGRKAESQALATFMKALNEGKFAGLMLISGEAGIGKSRLVYDFKNSTKLNANWIVLQTEELIRSAFNPFKAWLKKRFELAEDESKEENWDRFMRLVDEIAANARDPELGAELKRTASILASLTDLSHPDSLYEHLDAKARYENTFLALSALLRAESLSRPTTLLLEDAHWLDEDSAAFLDYFLRVLQAEEGEDYPLAIIATQRPEKQTHLASEKATVHLEVGQLSIEDIHALAEDILGKPITTALGKSLGQRAEGNPFFAEQILRYLADENHLHLDGETYTTYEASLNSIPLDVNAVLIARLDRLTQNVRETVQTASVLGREFIVDILVEMLLSQLEKLPRYVREAEQAKIWAHLSEIQYIFSHALLRDAAYSMQLAAHQQNLHALAFSAIKEVHKEDLKPYYGELAYHAEKGKLDKDALHYLILAGDLAMSAYQNRQAIDYFTRALSLLPEDALYEKFEITLKRVESAYNIGDSAAQESDLDTLDRLAKAVNDEKLTARTLIRRAYRASIMGEYQNAAEYATEAMSLSKNAADQESLLSAYIILPDALSHAGKLTEAKAYAQEGLDFARKIKNRHREASALNALGLVSLEMDGPLVAQPYQEKALEIARQLKDHNLQGKALNNLALSFASQGDYHATRSYFEEALAVFHEQGNEIGTGSTLANLGWLSGLLGDYSLAMNYYERSLVSARRLGQRHEEIYTYINLSASCYGQGLKEEAKDWAEKGLQLAEEMNDTTAKSWAYFYLGYAHLLNHDFAEAEKVLHQSLDMRNEAKTPALVTETRAALLEVYATQGDTEKASQEANEVFSYIEKDPALQGTEEPLRIYLALYRWLQKEKDPRAKALLQEAKELMDTQVSKLSSTEAQRRFVENIPWRRALRDA